LTDLSSSERIAAAATDVTPAGPEGPSHRPAEHRRAWLSIHEASALVGVSDATLRRWAEAGDVEAFVTPGGHRRFTRHALMKLLPTPVRAARTLSELGGTPDRVATYYRRELAAASAGSWVGSLAEEEREAFRQPGRQILVGVVGFLDTPTEHVGADHLASALAGAADYGRLARAHGLDVAATTDAFLRFRSPFLDELAMIARRRRLEASEAIGLIIAAASVFDRLLLALLEGHAGSSSPEAPEPAASPESRSQRLEE
jgi:excisionase family DNA binding protein